MKAKKDPVKPRFKTRIIHEEDEYTSGQTETGDPRYGKAGDGTSEKGMKIKKLVEDARKEGKPIAKDPDTGLSYRAGYKAGNMRVETEANTESPDPGSPKFVKIKVPKSKQQVLAEKKDSGKRLGKRRLERVPWLAGKNKRTESGYGPGYR